MTNTKTFSGKWYLYVSLIVLALFLAGSAQSQNPLIMDQFTADPTARVFGDRIYVYPSHDIYCTENTGRKNWFCMPDYHVYSSTDMQNWTDHGMILSQEDVPWADPTANSMWAPDAMERNGKYYFYFPTRRKGASDGESGFSIGVAVADSPTGPFVPQPEPIEGIEGIDPNVFIDKDGQPYIYWSQNKIYGAKLEDNMLELASEPKTFTEIPQKGHIEGPFVFERKGIYYMTYPHVANNTERLEYATGDNPMGPFTHRGVIMDESASGTWTNHHSIAKYQDQWILFYHDNDLSPDFDKNRSIRADSLFFNEDGTIEKVTPTHRGVGVTQSTAEIQFDRYSDKSAVGAAVVFLDRLDTFRGWKAVLNKPDAWMRYNQVDFGTESPKRMLIRARSLNGGTVAIQVAGQNDLVLSEVVIPAELDWKTFTAPVSAGVTGNRDLLLLLKDGNGVEVDWVKFEN